MTPVLIGIAGGSGSGKTYLARRIQRDAGPDRVARLSMDQYFRSGVTAPGVDPRDVNFDHPAHLDLRALIGHLERLKAGESVRVPTYDFRTQTQTPEAVEVVPAPVVLVEGLFVLAEPIVALFDLAVFLDVEPDQRLIGRLTRDIHERESAVDWAIDRYQRFVRPSYKTFVEPTMQNAHVVVDFTYRRSMFTELLAHVVRDYVQDAFDLRQFIADVRRDRFAPGVQPGKSFAPLALDIFRLAEIVPPTAGPETTEPMIVLSDSRNGTPGH